LFPVGDNPDTESRLIEVRNLTKHFPVKKGPPWTKSNRLVKAVDGIDFRLRRGETLGVVGESGCGKSTTSRLILRLEKPTKGGIRYCGADIQTMAGTELHAFRRAVQVVFQDPASALNPRMRIHEIVGEPLLVGGSHTKEDREKRIRGVIQEVGLRIEDLSKYPHQFSGGQRQRIAIARALGTRPELIILDEPVSSLDVSVRAQILTLLQSFQYDYGLTYIMIAHDLAAVRFLSHRIAVMYLGKIMEIGPCRQVYDRPAHPYTKALLAAALPCRPQAAQPDNLLSGEPPSPLNPPEGCRFHPRCDVGRAECGRREPELMEIRANHRVACHRARERLNGG
jgi:oligopeptide/dipeptide ABC transporter ATP-binding protein